MNIEIADRLVKLRKQKGLSQEELADKLGLSRQAVSKWERAEASPDTDNLICLAKIYGVSLDELLNTSDDVETIVEEQVKEEGVSEQELVRDGDEIRINENGVHLKDDDGAEIHIKDGAIHIHDKNGDKTYSYKDLKNKDKKRWVLNIVESILFGLAIITYILLGVLMGAWGYAWVLLFIPSILCSIVRCIFKRRFNQFNMPFAATFAYFFVCLWVPGLSADLWHPMWVIFLAIPLYYIIFGNIDRIIRGPSEEDDDDGDGHVEINIGNNQD